MDPTETVRRGYDAIADEYAEQRSRGGRGREIAAGMAADLPEDSLVLDAGCGSGGPAAHALADAHEVVGMDLSRGQLDRLDAELPGVPPVQGELTDLPFAADAFDGLVSSHAVIHVPRERHGAVFDEFARVLRPDGEAVVVVGNDAWEGRNPDWLDAGAEMYWSFHGRARNLALLRDAGFSIATEEAVVDELGGEFLFVRGRVPA